MISNHEWGDGEYVYFRTEISAVCWNDDLPLDGELEKSERYFIYTKTNSKPFEKIERFSTPVPNSDPFLMLFRQKINEIIDVVNKELSK